MFKNKSIISLIVLLFFVLNILTAQKPPYGPEQPGGCAELQTQNHLTENEIAFLPNNDILYSLRDTVLSSSSKGKRYVNEYYYISNIEKDFSKLSIKSMTEIVELMPLIYNTFDNYQNSQYKGIIIDSELKNLLISVLKSFNELSDDVKYNSIVNNLIKDVELVENKTKVEINEFMNQE